MYSDDELRPVSALQHFMFCPRRAALIYLEGLWSENRFTAEGRLLHRRVHDARRGEKRPGVRVARGLEIRSYRHGLVGKADVVEFHSSSPGQSPQVTIVEYKRGRPKPALDEPFHVQLCAQALCLEEMLGRGVSDGAIFFGRANRRVEVPLDTALREKTLAAIAALHELIGAGRTPAARYQARCRRCSLLHLCLPKALRPRATAARYLALATQPPAPDDA
ncbi:MAG TPA: CRISPR-associated protein Cas4, partial [Planctomycetaceae bacterium]|nr:CRISPR-associated protein Cas4 [Planctomycetaceae bacterium]